MISCLQKIDTAIEPLRKLSNCAISPVLDLAIRLFMADTFFWSGWQKFQNYLNGDWESTLYLFREVHIVPLLPPDAAAVLGTGNELILPVLLVVGLFTRFAAAGLLFTTILIQFFVMDSFGDDLMNSMHYLWMLLLAVPLVKGPGKLSLDALLVRFIRKEQ